MGAPAVPPLLALLDHDGADQRQVRRGDPRLDWAARSRGAAGGGAGRRRRQRPRGRGRGFGPVGGDEAASALELALDGRTRSCASRRWTRSRGWGGHRLCRCWWRSWRSPRSAARRTGGWAWWSPLGDRLVCRGSSMRSGGARVVLRRAGDAAQPGGARAPGGDREQGTDRAPAAGGRADRSAGRAGFGGAAVRTGAFWAVVALKDASLAGALAQVADDERLVTRSSPRSPSWGPRPGRPGGALPGLTAAARQAAGEALVQLASPSLVDRLTELLDVGESRISSCSRCARSARRRPWKPRARCSAPSPSPRSRWPARGRWSRSARASAARCSRTSRRWCAARPPRRRSSRSRGWGRGLAPRAQRSIRDADPPVRAATAEAVCEIAGEGSVDLVRLALADEVPEVRAAAARGLGRLADARAVRLLRLALAEETFVQAAGVDAAGDLGGTDLVPELRARRRARYSKGRRVRSGRSLAWARWPPRCWPPR